MVKIEMGWMCSVQLTDKIHLMVLLYVSFMLVMVMVRCMRLTSLMVGEYADGDENRNGVHICSVQLS